MESSVLVFSGPGLRPNRTMSSRMLDLRTALHEGGGWPIGTWNGRAFIEPTVINGRVYVASENYVRAFAL